MSEIRTASLELSPAREPDGHRQLLQALQELDGMETARLDGYRLELRYRFPDLAFDRIWGLLGDARPASAAGRLLPALRALLEANERDRRLGGGGWHSRVEAIYALEYRRRPPPPGSDRHLWHEYLGETGTPEQERAT